MRESDQAREAAEQQAAADFLRSAHNTAGLWRKCARKACRRMRTCSGDADACGARSFPEGWAWVRGLLLALREGARPRAAMRVADRQLIAMETDGAFGPMTRAVRVEYPGLGESFEMAARSRRRGLAGPARTPLRRVGKIAHAG